MCCTYNIVRTKNKIMADKTERIYMRASCDFADKVNTYCKIYNLKKTEFIQAAVEEFLERKSGRPISLRSGPFDGDIEEMPLYPN